MSSYSQQERRETTGNTTTSTSDAEHDDLQETLGNSAIQDMLNYSSVPHDSVYANVYQKHVNQDANINISLSENQMRNVTTFQEHWEKHQARYVAVSQATDIPPKLIQVPIVRAFAAGARARVLLDHTISALMSLPDYLHQPISRA